MAKYTFCQKIDAFYQASKAKRRNTSLVDNRFPRQFSPGAQASRKVVPWVVLPWGGARPSIRFLGRHSRTPNG
jgi:hypothetical protein